MQRKKGISLIVLVITIIVMIILAGVVILTLRNDDVISDANKAVDLTNKNQVQQLAEVKWAHAYNNGVRTQEELRAAVLEGLENEGIDYGMYGIDVTTAGVTIKKGWLQTGFKVVKGDQILEIGDVVNYDETVGGAKTGLKATDWKVLGADDNGNLLIMSTGNITLGKMLGDKNDLQKSQQDWLNVVSILDAECEPYGYGKGVNRAARSITADDVNKITGYDPTKYDFNGTSGKPYAEGYVYQYGNTIKYKYNGTITPEYTSVVKEGTLEGYHDKGFYYYDGTELNHITDVTTGTKGEEFATITSNFYSYDATKLETISKTENEKAYSMLFGDRYTNYSYWLATPIVKADQANASYGVLILSIGRIGAYFLWNTQGSSDTYGLYLRAVVTLSSELNFTGSSETGWSY